MKEINTKRKEHINLRYIGIYSLLVLVFCMLAFMCFIVRNRSFVWKGDSGDGLVQHFNALAYYGEYLRGIFGNFIENHRLEIPMWDLRLGYGSDIFTTLHYYVIGDPLNLLSIFVPADKTEYLYGALVLVRIYLSGISFSCYSFYHKNRKDATLLGAILYCFSGFVLNIAMKHPYFINPMIYLPLLLLGVDKIYKKEKPYLFIIMVAISGMSNFYFFYMLCAFVVLYAVVRYLAIFKKIRWKELIAWVGKFVGYAIVGVAIAAVILLPVIFSSFGTDRFGVEFYLPFLYPVKYYGGLLLYFMTGKTGYYTMLGYSSIGFLAVAVLYIRKKEHTLLKILLLIMTMFLCIPFVGHVLNGFSYVTNRWIWAYSMLIAYIFVKVYPMLWELSSKEKKKLFVVTGGYIFICLYFRRDIREIAAIVSLIAAVAAICTLKKWSTSQKIRCGFILSLLGICVFFNGWFLYSPRGENYIEEFVDGGKAMDLLTKEASSSTVSSLAKQQDGYRYDKSYQVKEYSNTALPLRLNGTGYYFSLDNASVSKFLDEMYIKSASTHHYNCLDSRGILEEMSSVKYFLANAGEKASVPYQYKKKKVLTTEDYEVYEGSGLPLGFTYDSYVPRNVYDTLSVTQKQQAILQGIVVEKSNLKKTQLTFYDKTPAYTIELGEGVELEENKFCVKKGNSSVTLRCEGIENSEVYVIFQGLHFKSNKKIRTALRMRTKQTKNTLHFKNNRDNFYAGRHHYLINLGYHQKPVSTITISFKEKGVYTYDKMWISCQPMQVLDSYIEARGEDVLENIKYTGNTIEGDISLNQSKMLYLSIPYSAGWTAYVDGQKQELQQANSLGMAIELSEGYHQIKLCYVTPFIKLGLFCSVVGIISLFGIWIWHRQSKKFTRLT